MRSSRGRSLFPQLSLMQTLEPTLKQHLSPTGYQPPSEALTSDAHLAFHLGASEEGTRILAVIQLSTTYTLSSDPQLALCRVSCSWATCLLDLYQAP